MRPLSTALLLLFLLAAPSTPAAAYSDSNGSLYPPGLHPLINRANSLLTAGQFTEAAKLYTEAIDQSPTDYLLHYKRATAYMSLSKHSFALDDFDKVLTLTSDTFDLAYLMKARIHTRDGDFEPARAALVKYKKAKAKGGSSANLSSDVQQLEVVIEDGQRMKDKAEKERRAQLWNACVETTSGALGTASHSVEIREWRAECALAAGDVESAVGDLTRLSHLLPPSTTLLSRIFRLSYFFTPPSSTPQNTIKQCLHYDPDSKACLGLRRTAKSLDRSFSKLDDLLNANDWRGVVRLLTASGKENNLLGRYDDALKENANKDHLVPPPSSEAANKKSKHAPPKIPIPDPFKYSPLRQTLIRSLCKAYTNLADSSKSDLDARKSMGKWCEELLTMHECQGDLDGLVGRAEFLLASPSGAESGKWEEAVRLLEKAFESTGRSDKKIYTRLNKAQRMMKQSKQKDYYKILGVARDADDQTIKKAFRRAAKEAHPDKGGSEAAMAALNEAYEVLSDPELRARFDAGEDPNDPMAGHGGGNQGFGGATYAFNGFPGAGFGAQHPFAQFFGGGDGHGGPQFKFHFG